jgi:hypothetical protein
VVGSAFCAVVLLLIRMLCLAISRKTSVIYTGQEFFGTLLPCSQRREAAV